MEGRWAKPAELGDRLRHLHQSDTNWADYAVKDEDPNRDYRPRRAVLGGAVVISDPSRLEGKMTLEKVQGSVYRVILVGGGDDGGNGYIVDGVGRPLMIDLGKVPPRSKWALVEPGKVPPIYDIESMAWP